MLYKKSFFLLGLSTAILATGGPVATWAHLPTQVDGESLRSLSPMLEKTTPAVVNISVEKEIPNQTADGNTVTLIPPTKAIAVGSGVIIDAPKGYIVTNAHIISHQKVIIVTLKDGRRYHAQLIGTDDGFDIAVIQIHAQKLTAMKLGNSNNLKVGDFVVAVGSPFGLSQTVTSGVVSAINRATPKIEGFQNFIQTDASINPGNSGGALINMQGEFIGMNTAILAPSMGNIGIGFAIPSLMVKNVAAQLIQYGKVTPGILGIIAQNITPEIAEALQLKDMETGVLVTQVFEGSPAEKAGIKEEDVILSIDGCAIHSSAEIHNLMGITHPDTKIIISVLRNNNKLAIPAIVGNPTAKVKKHITPYLSGLRLQDFSDFEPDSTIMKGVLVLDVTDTSAGALAGLIPGDVLIKANGKDIDSVRALMEITKQSKEGVLLKVVRGMTNMFLVIEPDQ